LYQKQLEEEASKQPIEPPEEEAPLPEPKPKSVVQMIYKENKVCCYAKQNV